MSLLARNVTGDDLLALWNHIEKNGPTEKQRLLSRYYPGDSEDPNQSDSRKPLEDAINFLEESDQIVQQEEGYTLRKECLEAISPQVSLLKGLRAQTGEDAVYMGILDVLTEENKRYFDAKNELNDLLSKKRSSINWTTNKISYWARTMSMLEVIAPINSDSNEGHTHLLSISQRLLLDILKDAFSPNEPIKLESVTTELNENYLPVYATTNRNIMAKYLQNALIRAESNESITLRRSSDFGASIEIDGSGYNELTLRVSENT